MSLHIAFFNFPAIGHVNPTLGLVEELVRRGHRVTCTVTDHFAPAVEAAGAEAVRYSSVFGDFYRSPYTEETLSGEGLRCLEEATSLVEQVGDFYRKNPPDVICHDFMAWGGRFLAARENIPAVRLFPTYGANETFSIQAKFPLAEFTDAKVVEMMEKLVALLPEMGMPGASAMDFFTHIEKLGVIFLPRDFHYDGDTFDERFVFAGPCLGDRSSFQGTWRPASPDRPVLLISLGTAGTGWSEFFPMAVEAFTDGPWDVVMAVGDHIDIAELGEIPPGFDVRRHVPQLDVLRDADLFITHGGMNSTMESLHNGVPMVVIPQMNEQRANALRVDELGLGRHLAPEDTTVESLRRTAAEVVQDKAIADRIRAMQSEMRSVNGPVVAADAVEQYLKANG